MDIGKGSSEFLRQTYQVIFANGNNLDGIGKFIIGSVGVSIG